MQQNKLRLSDFDDFNDGHEMCEGLEMNELPGISFWCYIEHLREANKHESHGDEEEDAKTETGTDGINDVTMAEAHNCKKTKNKKNSSTGNTTRSGSNTNTDKKYMTSRIFDNTSRSGSNTHSKSNTENRNKERNNNAENNRNNDYQEDEKKQQTHTNTNHVGGEIGFKNLGNTCFLNSALQVT